MLSPRQKAQSAQTSMFEAFALGETAARVGELPDTLEAGAVAYRAVLERYNAAMLAHDDTAVRMAKEDADAIAIRLNGGERCGIFGSQEASGYQLERATAADEGLIPMHGQTGEFVLQMDGFAVRVQMRGMMFLGGFEARSLDGKPFPVSDTGYRSFVSCTHGGVGGLEVEPFVRAVIAAHLKPAPKTSKKHKKGDDCSDDDLWED